MRAQITGRFSSISAKNNDAFCRCPIITVSIGVDPAWEKSQVGAPQLLARDLVGLIDTGADLCRIDDSLARRISLPLGAAVSSKTGAGEYVSDTYVGLIHIPEINFTLKTHMAANDFRSQGQLFDLILGMTFLRLFDLRICASKQNITLTIAAQSVNEIQ